MVKQNASCDASFWINACAAGVVEQLAVYFQIFAPTVVAEEIRYPLRVLNIPAQSSLLFDAWVESGRIVLLDPQKPVTWFQPGENAAIALAIELNYLLLMDDANPYHRVRAAGLKVVGTTEFIVLLFDHGRIAYEIAVAAIKQTHASKNQKREGLVMLELLARRKG